MEEIKYISYASINKEKWNECIDQSANGLIYCYSWYLDAMAQQWDALVLNDYEAVMPLTWNKKYGISYLYQPYFCASLGIFSVQPLTAVLTEQFLKAIPARFRYIDIYLNKGNLFSVTGFPLTEPIKYVLTLNKSYNAISDS
jgi:hypothetical protein